MRALRGLFMFGLVVWGMLSPGILSAVQPERYQFRVFLDEKEIGRHSFTVTSKGEETTVDIEASFDVKFLFFTAYRYRHTNKEVWNGGCLRRIDSRTEDGGKTFFAEGRYGEGVLQVKNREGSYEADGCVISFAYWNSSALKGERLLNSQTGQIDSVEIIELGADTVTVRGDSIMTTHRRIVGEKYAIDLWYDLNGKWVALESDTARGGRLRYVIE